MARIVIRNLSEKSFEIQDFSKSLLRHVHDHAIDWMHACGGKGRCTTCKVIILEGIENLEPKTQAELKYESQGLLSGNERLACQVIVGGTIQIEVPDEGKLPHVKYSN